MRALTLTARGTAAGMTLMEVLAAVFILGLGLIMVAGAFPVAALQTQMTREQTESATLARSALELCRWEKYVRDLTVRDYQGDNKGMPITVSRSPSDDTSRVWNGHRWMYLENTLDSKMWPPGGGDYVWQPFLTRVSATNEAPLFRLTVVVVRFSPAAPDFYDPATQDNTIRKVSLRRSSDARTLTGSNLDKVMAPGDYIMDPRTGFCHRVATVEKSKVTLGSTPDRALETSSLPYFIVSKPVGIFHTLISE